MQLSGLTAVASELVKPPRIAEAAVQMECKVRIYGSVELLLHSI